MAEFIEVLYQKEARNSEMLPALIFDLLREQQLTLALAESVTGGDISALMTTVPGISTSYVGGVIAYSNQLKVSECNVNPKTIQRFGSVSPQTTLEMAQGIRQKFQPGIALATTGFAGPARNNENVGQSYVAIVVNRQELVKPFHFSGDRREIIRQITFAALDYLKYVLTNIKGG